MEHFYGIFLEKIIVNSTAFSFSECVTFGRFFRKNTTFCFFISFISKKLQYGTSIYTTGGELCFHDIPKKWNNYLYWYVFINSVLSNNKVTYQPYPNSFHTLEYLTYSTNIILKKCMINDFFKKYYDLRQKLLGV